MSDQHEPLGGSARDVALREYLRLRLRAFVRRVAAAGLAVSDDEAMRNNAAQWTREFQQSTAARPTQPTQENR